MTIEDLQTAAGGRGGACLESKYGGFRAGHRWRCAEGHEWEATPQKVVAGNRTWCPECAGVRARGLAAMQHLAKEKAGRCLSTEYVNNNTHLEWEGAHGHRWQSRPRVIQAGHWCPRCAKRDRPGHRLTLEELEATAIERGGECLATDYRHNRELLPWRCARGHEFEATARSVRQGTWCRVCANLDPAPIRRFQDIATRRGGECLSAMYVSSRTKLRFRCAKGHQWEALPHSLVAGSWCRRCARGGRRPAGA